MIQPSDGVLAVSGMLAAYTAWYTWRAYKTGSFHGRGLYARRERDPIIFYGLLALNLLIVASLGIGVVVALVFGLKL